MAADPVPDPQVRRLLWRCRRGMKELDLVLERFARETLPAASGAERALFDALLELPDPLLAAYLLTGEAPSDPRLAALTARILTLCREAHRPGVSWGRERPPDAELSR